jgi:hypothetical protein
MDAQKRQMVVYIHQIYHAQIYYATISGKFSAPIDKKLCHETPWTINISETAILIFMIVGYLMNQILRVNSSIIFI